MKSTLFTALALLTAPAFVFAQRDPDLGNFTTLVEGVQDIIDLLIPVAASLAVLFFFWNLAQFVLGSKSAEDKAENKSSMLWGLVAIFVIFSLWGLVEFLRDTFGVERGSNQNVPSIAS
jgi:hypothetical protein